MPQTVAVPETEENGPKSSIVPAPRRRRRWRKARRRAETGLPAVRNEDSLPLSTYPMYSGTRSNLSRFVTATGVDERGSRSTLSALTISGSRDRLIAQSFLNDAVQRGEESLVCADIASRVDTTFEKVEIASEQHDTIARLRGDESLRQRDVLASCEVPR